MFSVGLCGGFGCSISGVCRVNSVPFESAWPWMKGGCMKGSVSVMDEGALAMGGVMRGIKSWLREVFGQVGMMVLWLWGGFHGHVGFCSASAVMEGALIMDGLFVFRNH